MTKLNHMAWIVLCALPIYMSAAAEAGAAATTSPKLLACLNACDETLMACAQTELKRPVLQRTIKELNRVRACSVTEGTCDRRCRGK